ncbi:MAG: addiction module protein [Terriglobales bacterium]
MAQMSPELSKLLDEASMLPIEEREVLAQSLISTLKGEVDEGVMEAWEAEIGKRVAGLDSGAAKTISWEEVRARNLKKLPHAQ